MSKKSGLHTPLRLLSPAATVMTAAIDGASDDADAAAVADAAGVVAAAADAAADEEEERQRIPGIGLLTVVHILASVYNPTPNQLGVRLYTEA